ncbi:MULTISPECIES: 1-acyl-sn-glycerol-3-phosphate acyltransferase [Ferrimonas]|uniref:lysophospholipid acyltransferase family protein n=1 Tax=Ferrimonas TaxID=44011 RepID=UPI0003FC90C7|nr:MULTISPECIES: lysophospholipid acyltransferase family protein [Ferrimonas]USD38997.1 1-acyl-sn-glycerol-3-phosphate acyltransferase [Ferrimonas sp. SCSIO 43195]
MIRALYHGYRILATGLSFAVFGLGGLIAGIGLFPLLSLLPGAPAQKQRRAQRCVHWLFRFFVRFMELLWVTRVVIDQPQRLQQAKGMVIIANHPCLLDVVVLISAIPHTNCIVKQSLLRNPFMRWVIKAAGYIANDCPDDVVRLSRQKLQQGDNIIVFPEGTRTTPGAPIKMQRGAARIVLGSRATVLPITLRCTPTTLTKGTPWYRVSPSRFVISMNVGDPIDCPADEGAPESLQVRRLTREMEQRFNTELEKE